MSETAAGGGGGGSSMTQPRRCQVNLTKLKEGPLWTMF